MVINELIIINLTNKLIIINELVMEWNVNCNVVFLGLEPQGVNGLLKLQCYWNVVIIIPRAQLF
jgi:hypothetical protein